jgi:integrase
VADMVKLKYQNIVDGEICYVRQKTERTTKSRRELCVPITDHMRKIIERWGNQPLSDNYIFPILSGNEDAFKLKYKTKYFTRAINRRMSIIGANLGIGNISTYTARHSFATVLKRAGTNIAYISESLGHKDLKTTEHYLSKFEQEVRKKNAELLTSF